MTRLKVESIEPGEVFLTLNDKIISEPIAFNATTQEALVLPDVSSYLSLAKTQSLGIIMKDGSPIPYSLEISYNSHLQPPHRIAPPYKNKPSP